LRARVRRAYVVSLRKSGATLSMILRACQQHFGEELPRAYNRNHVAKDLRRALAAMDQQMHDDLLLVRHLELERLDDLLLPVWGRARLGELEAVLVVLKIMERRARLLGLDSPMRYAHTTSAGQDVAAGEKTRGVAEAELREVALTLAAFGQLLMGEGRERP
jgi:hypothetical protein